MHGDYVNENVKCHFIFIAEMFEISIFDAFGPINAESCNLGIWNDQ